MKKLLYRTDKDLDKRFKTMSIIQESEDEDSTTVIKKEFSYKVDEAEYSYEENAKPRVDIIKSMDTKLRLEKLHFIVRGAFFVNHNRRLVKVNFKHSLNIKIYWKKEIFSPKKSAVLTE